MTTPRDICLLALKMCGSVGVGQTPLAEDINDTFTLLNMMLGQWAQKRWLVYDLVDVVAPVTTTSNFTIGIGGQLNVPRPDKIEAAYVQYGSTFNYSLEIIEAREDWNRVGLNNGAGMPSVLFYDSGYPLGTVYVYPIAANGYQVHLSLKQPLTAFANLSSDIALPAEYEEALLYNLAVRLFPMYGLPPRADVVAMAKASLNTIRNSNTQIATLRMPPDLPGVRSGGRYGGFGYGGGIGIVPPNPGNGGSNSASSSVLNVGVLNTMILAQGSGDFASADFSSVDFLTS